MSKNKNKSKINNNINYIIIIVSNILILLLINLYNNYIKWENKDAIKQYKLLTRKYGNPSNKDLSKGGIAIWKKEKLLDTCFEYIEILDESIAHCVPSPHRDFLYTYVKYEIPDDKVLDVISLSGSVAYDPLKKTLRARCATEEANIATLYLALAIGNSIISLDEVQKNKLYGKTIKSTIDSQNVQIYYDKICEYLENQPGNPEWTGYFPLAFPEGCCDGYDPINNTCGNINENFYNDKSDKENFYNDKSDKENFYNDKSYKENFYNDKSDKGYDDIEPVLL